MKGNRRHFQAVPRRARLLSPVLVLVAAFLAVIVPTWIAAGFVGGQYLEPKGVHIGQLRANRNPIAITLPAGIALDEILVNRGDLVKAGQTVATIDQDAVRAAVNRLENETAALVLERRCLLDPSVFEGMEPVAFDALDEMEQLIGIALRSCRDLEADGQYERALIVEDRLALMEKREELLKKQSELIVVAGLGEAPPNDNAVLVAALQIQLEINDIRLDENFLRSEIEYITRSIEAARLTRLRQLSNIIAENTDLLGRLNAALRTPRLQSPRNGQVQRVRAMRRGDSVMSSTDIIEISDEEQQNFEVTFNVSYDNSDTFEIGQMLNVQPVGGAGVFPDPLRAEVIRITADPELASKRELTVALGLSRQSEQVIMDENSHVALIGPETAAVVTVELPRQKIEHSLARVLQDNCMKTIEKNCGVRDPSSPDFQGVQK